ncbi:Inhibitor of Bruton tyrosine kinase [Dirofilaria immitis]
MLLMDTLWRTIARKYPKLRMDGRFMSGCLYGLIQADLSKFGCVSDELALQIRTIAMVCVQAVYKADKAFWPLSSLHLAAYYNSVELLEILLEIFDYNEIMTLEGLTPAQLAAMKGHLRALAVLYRNVGINIYCCVGGFSAYEFLKNFAKCEEKEKLCCLSRIYVCGDNDTQSLGVMYGKHATYPVPVQFFDESSFGKEVTQVSFGKYHTIYLIDGRVFSCGLGRYGKLGHGDEKDQLKIREIKFLESVVCVCAGLTHSIICTRKKIIVFGLNNKGQLGLGTKQLVLIPTIAKFFKENTSYITDCSTNDSHSVIIMSNFDFYVTGTSNGFLWQKYSGNTFRHVKNNYAHRTSSISATDSFMISINSKEDSSKITVKADGKNYYITSSINIKRCIGVCYTPQLSVVFSGFKHFYENHNAVTSELFLFDSKIHGLLRSLCFYNTLLKRNIFGVTNADIARDGQIIIVDHMGDVYEGNLARYALFSDPYFDNASNASSWVVDYIVKVKVSRLYGILPAKNAFLTPDGKNKVLNLLEIDPRSVLHHTENVSKVEFPNCNIATVICMSENGEELGRYETSLEVLKYESDVCLSYFERWANDKKKEIQITARPEILEIFLSFCCEHCLRPDLSMQELIELLIFADKLLCKNFFNIIKYELFKPPFEISNLRDLFGVARHLSSMELYQNLSELCAAIFPILLENGFVNKLSLDEIAYIEDAFRSYGLKDLVRSVDQFETSITNSVVPEKTIGNIIMDVLAIVKKPMDIKKLIDFCKCIKNGSHPKKRRKHMRSSNSAINMVRIRKCGLEKELSADEKVDSCVQMPNILSKATFEFVDIEKKFPSLSDIQVTIATNEVCGNSTFKTYPFVSLSNILAEGEGTTDETKQKVKKDVYISSRRIAENIRRLPRRTSNSWHLDESMTFGNSFAQIMEDERARQLETVRQTCSRLSDIDLEEQAMAELIAQYEGEAAVQGISITVSTERKVEEINDPLWVARS